MPTILKPKPPVKLKIKKTLLNNAEKKEIKSILQCDSGIIAELEQQLRMARGGMQYAANRPRSPHIIAELIKIRKAAASLGPLLMRDKLTPETRTLINIRCRQEGIITNYCDLGSQIQLLGWDAQVAIHVAKTMALGVKHTGGTTKKIIADQKTKLIKMFSKFFDAHASAYAKARPKDKAAFLKICSKIISPQNG